MLHQERLYRWPVQPNYVSRLEEKKYVQRGVLRVTLEIQFLRESISRELDKFKNSRKKERLAQKGANEKPMLRLLPTTHAVIIYKRDVPPQTEVGKRRTRSVSILETFQPLKSLRLQVCSFISHHLSPN